jgi:serine/threonine protein kinase
LILAENMEFVSFVGQTLDGKYKIEREIGRGGMGTVYLSTHIGTERPQYMQRTEFVERFRREARAAGRLRHPNVVDVTDFGFAETAKGKVAYLVMEYLDGVTLGEVLEEEKKLPLAWSLDILEQVCSAVSEAHAQGIIHRDLKPDNIWLEPNQRGGYTVKVLDFGIAKLEENMAQAAAEEIRISKPPSLPATSDFRQTTIGGETQTNTIVENKSATVISEAGTLLQDNPHSEAGTMLQTSESEDKTAIFGSDKQTISIEENFKTKLMSAEVQTNNSPLDTPATKDLTRVGAVLGTPLYMSPEQCRGEKLEKSSDIYSLGVIAYQMLSGDTPFTGDFKTVMQAHREQEPPQLNTKKIPKKVRQTIFSALAKDKNERGVCRPAPRRKRRHRRTFAKIAGHLQRTSAEISARRASDDSARHFAFAGERNAGTFGDFRGYRRKYFADDYGRFDWHCDVFRADIFFRVSGRHYDVDCRADFSCAAAPD